MEINKLVDLNNLRTAPQLTNIQEKKLFQPNVLPFQAHIEAGTSSKEI